MNKTQKKERNENLYKAILSLRTLDECMRFFDDLCTAPELIAMEQRFRVADCLNNGMIYNDILAETGASTKREMGRVMGALTQKTGGNFDKATAAAELGKRLS